MAKTYSKKDIFDGKLFDEAINEANQMIKVLEVMDTKIVQLSNTYKTTLNSATTNNKKGIEDIIKVSNELNVVTEQAHKIEKDKIATSEKLRKAELDQAKAYEQFTKEVQKRQAIEEKAHAKREQQYNKEIQQTEKIAQKEAERAEKLSGSYAKVQIKLNQLSNVYRDLAIKKEMGLKLTDKEEKRYTSLQGRIQMYDKALKQTDASMGKHQRNVGNYASAYNGLGMSVSQLAREMPAFANSVQTGFMAISNNLPMFFDEIKKITTANKELKASGQPTVSLFKQLAGSVFSVSTLLSIGVTLLTVYGAKIVEMITGTKELSETQKELIKIKEETNDKGETEIRIFQEAIKALKATNAGSKEREYYIKAINDKYGTTLKNLKDEEQFLRNVNAEQDNYIKLSRKRIQDDINQETAKKYIKRVEDLKRYISKTQTDMMNIAFEGEGALTGLGDKMADAWDQAMGNKSVTGQKSQFTILSENVESAKRQIDNLNKTIDYLLKPELDLKLDSYGGKTKTWSNNTKELATQLDRVDEFLTKQNELLNERDSMNFERDIQAVDDAMQKELEKQIENINKGNDYDYKELWNLLETKKQLRLQYLDEETEIELQKVREKYQAEGQAELDALNANRDKLIADGGNRAEIEASYQEQLKKHQENQLQRTADLKLEEEIILIDAGKKREEILKEEVKLETDANKQIEDALKDHNEKTKQEKERKDKEEKDKEKAHLKEMADLRKSYLNGIFDEMKRISNEKEALLDKEIEAEKKQQDALQAQANAGNIDAQNSIKASIEAQKQATVEKQKEVDKQRRYDELKMLYNLIEAKIEKGDGAIQATGKSMAEMAIIKGAAKLLSGFKKGTKKRVQDEMKPNVDLGSDPDNRIIRVAGDEAILTGEKMDLLEKFGIHTTDEIVNNAIKAKVNIKQDVAGNSYDLLLLQNELKSIKDAIINKPETNIELGLITQNAMEIIERRTQGNKTTTNAFKVK